MQSSASHKSGKYFTKHVGNNTTDIPENATPYVMCLYAVYTKRFTHLYNINILACNVATVCSSNNSSSKKNISSKTTKDY